MPMTVSSLSGKMLNNLKATFSPEDDRLLKATCDAYAAAIIDEITTNAVVDTADIVVAPPLDTLVSPTGPVTGTIFSRQEIGKIK